MASIYRWVSANHATNYATQETVVMRTLCALVEQPRDITLAFVSPDFMGPDCAITVYVRVPLSGYDFQKKKVLLFSMYTRHLLRWSKFMFAMP